MTVRTAELLMAIAMAALSVYFMYEAYKLPVGWIEDEGPGGGFWPFWLATIMLLSCGWIGVNWVHLTVLVLSLLAIAWQTGWRVRWRRRRVATA